MASYPVEIKRCQHIKTSGAQCGSPALKDKEFCYYHQENRAVPAVIYLEGDRHPDGPIMIPPLEDAHAIQTVLRHVLLLMMEHRMERKDASLILYGLQIASGNLKQMQAEKPRPTQVVRDPEKVAETPMGMTPWSAKGEGHEIEEPAEVQREREVREIDENWRALYQEGQRWMLNWSRHIRDWQDKLDIECDWVQATNYLGEIRENMKQTAEEMGKRLEAGVG